MKAAKGYILLELPPKLKEVVSNGVVLPIEQAEVYQPQRYAIKHGFNNGYTYYFHFNTVQNCKQQGQYFVDGGKEFISIPPTTPYLRVQQCDGKVEMLNDWFLCEKILAKEEKIGLIYIPETAQKEYVDGEYIVRHVPDGVEDISLGDRVKTLKDCDIPLEDDLTATMGDYFRIHYDSIVGIVV